MPAVPIKNFQIGFIDAVTHPLTGAQVLYYLMHVWEDEPNRPVIVWCRRNEALWKANAVRVALSKERKARGLHRIFELRFSGTWNHTHEGVKGESIKIERVGGTMQTRLRATLMNLATQRNEGL